LSNVPKTLFYAKFDAHDALEDVKTLRKILFTAPLQVPNETHGSITANLHRRMTPSSENKIASSHAYDDIETSTDRQKKSLSMHTIQNMTDPVTHFKPFGHHWRQPLNKLIAKCHQTKEFSS